VPKGGASFSMRFCAVVRKAIVETAADVQQTVTQTKTP